MEFREWLIQSEWVSEAARAALHDPSLKRRWRYASVHEHFLKTEVMQTQEFYRLLDRYFEETVLTSAL